MKFSILIPVIKTAFLDQCVQSVLSQTFSDFEIIIVDDCSPDNVQDCLQPIKDPRLKYFRTPTNLGAKDPTATWNFALQKSTGDYVVLLGDDDFLSTNYLAEMNELTVLYPEASIFRSRLVLTDAHGFPFLFGNSLPTTETWDEMLYYRVMFGSSSRCQSSSEMCVKHASLLQIGGYVPMPLAMGSDDLTWLQLSLTHPVISTNKAFAYWRRHKNSLSTFSIPPHSFYAAMALLYHQLLDILLHHEPKVIPKPLLLTLLQTKVKTFNFAKKWPPIIIFALGKIKARFSS